MRSIIEQRLIESAEIERRLLQGAASLCIPAFGRACKGIWPLKTAEELAALVGCSVRAIGYQLSGEHDPSPQSILVVMNKIIPVHRKPMAK